MAEQTWWRPVIERSRRAGRLARLAAELAETVDVLYTAAAIIYAELPPESELPAEDRERRDLARLLARAVRKPGEFAWGQDLHDTFRERLRLLFGSRESPVPPRWPELRP